MTVLLNIFLRVFIFIVDIYIFLEIILNDNHFNKNCSIIRFKMADMRQGDRYCTVCLSPPIDHWFPNRAQEGKMLVRLNAIGIHFQGSRSKCC